MKHIKTEGISYIEPVSGAGPEWYYGMDDDHGDLYEAEEIYKEGRTVKGRKLCLIHYPDGTVYWPVIKKEGCYCERPVYFEGGIYILNVDFTNGKIQILCFDCERHQVELREELPLSEVKDCYNLSLQTAPLTLTRQSVGKNELTIFWPEKISLPLGDHDSFFLRDGDRLYFSRWHEEGEGEDYRYWEETIVKNLSGEVVETLPGDVMRMPDGKLWHIS